MISHIVDTYSTANGQNVVIGWIEKDREDKIDFGLIFNSNGGGWSKNYNLNNTANFMTPENWELAWRHKPH